MFADLRVAPQYLFGHRGRRALVGQYKAAGFRPDGKACLVDMSERINFQNSRYVPGNGREHRLGRQ